MELNINPDIYNSYPKTGSLNIVNNIQSASVPYYLENKLANVTGRYCVTSGPFIDLSGAAFSGAEIILEIIPQEKTNKLESILTDISETFKLTKDQQVAIYRIQSRKTVYNWIDKTSVPHQTTMRRIYALFSITEAWQQAGFQITKEELLYPILNDLSVFNLLSQDVLDKEQILFAGSRLNLEREISTPFNDPFV